MKRLFFIIATQILFMSIFTACNTSGSTETTVSASVPTVDMNEPIIWNEYDRIDSVNSSNGILLYWPDALGAKSYRIYVNDNKPVTTTENTYMISSENANAKVFAIGENGEELAVLNWTAGERVETNVQEGWFDLYSMPTDSEIHLQSANGIPVSNLINLDMTSYSHVKICYEAKVLSYTTGPSHYTGRPDDCASAGVKICMGDTRTLISTERDSIVAGVGSATWGNAVSYSAGNEWHSYEVLMDNSQNIYTVFIDGDAIISGEQSARTMIANNVEFFAMGTAGNPADVTLKNIKITCRTENILPIWDYSSKISSISHQDGFTLVWPAAINAEYYIVQIGENTPVKVTDNVYRAANLSHQNSGYDVKVQAYLNRYPSRGQ